MGYGLKLDDVADGLSIDTFFGICIDPDSEFLLGEPDEIVSKLNEAVTRLEYLRNFERVVSLLHEAKAILKRPWIIDYFGDDALNLLLEFELNIYAEPGQLQTRNEILAVVQQYRDKRAQKRIANKSIKAQVMSRDHFKCRYCDKSLDKKEVRIDHVIPYSLGGLTEVDNLVTACNPCNAKKSGKTLEQAGMTLIPLF